ARSRLKLKRGGDHAPRGQSRDRHRRCARHGRGGGAALRPGRRQGRRRRRVRRAGRGRSSRHSRSWRRSPRGYNRRHQRAAWVALIEKTVARYGQLDILVNNAGISGSSVGDPDGLEGWHRIIAVNQTSVFLGTKLAAEQMAKTGGGSIVHISSILGFVGVASGHPAYSASKGAVRIYTKSAAVRYGPLGIRVNSVHPGYMPPMLNATNANERTDKIALTPLRRLGEPIEVAYGVLFLASDEASFVTGTELVVDGGFIAQ